MKIRILISIILIINSCNVCAQIFDDSQAPPNIKWDQISTDDFQLIFPKEFHIEAFTLATELTSITKKVKRDLRLKPRKITFIIQTSTLEQNGYVQLAPRKSELFATPSGVASNQSWLDNLAVHEYRHVVQFDNLAAKFKAPLFEQLGLALYGLHLPSWYFEGDAVHIETVLTNGGRGRLPSWEMPIRTNLIEGRHYTYEKYILGSYKDIVPSYYTIGYFLATRLKNEYGDDIQDRLLTHVRNNLLKPYSFNSALKKETGMSASKLYTTTIKELANRWKAEERLKSPVTYQHIRTKISKYPQSWLLPQKDQSGHLYTLYQSPELITQIVKIDSATGSQISILKTGRQLMPYYDLKGYQIVWDENRRDARYDKRDYNVINIHDLTSGQTRTLTTRTRYYNPALNYLSSQIACISVDMSNRTSLVILDPKTGNILNSILAPEDIHLQQPQFNQHGNKVITIGVSQHGTCLFEYDFIGKKWSQLTSWSNQQLERPIYQLNNIIFKAHYNGTDNLYRYDTEKKNITSITNTRFGAFNPFYDVDGHQLYFNDYAVDGYRPSVIQLDTIQEVDINTTADQFIHYYRASLPLFDTISRSTSIDAATFKIAPYKGLKRLLNFHSLTISSTDFSSFDNYKPGIFWISNNLMNTTKVSLGYEYDTDLNKGIYSAELKYQKYFPKLSLRYENKSQIGRAAYMSKPDSVVSFEWQEHLATAQISLPWTIYRQNQIYSYGLNVATYYQNRYNQSIDNIPNFRKELKFPMSYQVYLNRNSMMSKMDLAPRWGQNLSFTFRHSPFETAIGGTITSWRSSFYFPGVANNHSLQVRLSAQKASEVYQYTTDIPTVSGYGHFNSEKVQNTLLLNYRMPLAYPDWTIGGLAYIKRFKGGLFADYQNIHKNNATPKTFGINLSADVNFLRYVLPDFECGMKLTYINDSSAKQKIVPSFSLGYTY